MVKDIALSVTTIINQDTKHGHFTDELSQRKVSIHNYNNIALDAELKMHCFILM